MHNSRISSTYAAPAFPSGKGSIDGIEDMTVAEFCAYKQTKGIDLPEADLSRGNYYDLSNLEDIPGGVARGIVEHYDEDGEPIFRTDERGEILLVDHYIYHRETDEYEYIYLKTPPIYELECYNDAGSKNTVYCLGITSDGHVIYRRQNGEYCCRRAVDFFDYVDGEYVLK